MAREQFLILLLTIELLVYSFVLGNQCPPDWKRVGEACYHVVTEDMTWDKAAEKCRDLGGGLAVPESKLEQEGVWALIKRELSTSSESISVWFGCTKVVNGVWGCGELNSDEEKFSYWAEGQPNGEGERCARMKGALGGRWTDQPCADSYNAICKTTLDVAVRAYCFMIDDKGRITSQCLTGHVIKELPIKGVIACGSACRDEPQCRSFNVRDASQGINKTCQLNDKTRQEVERNKFVDDENCYYHNI